MNRISKAIFAVTGSKKELSDFECVLRSWDIDGVMSNEGSRLLELKWIVAYADFKEDKTECKMTYAYRTTNCKDTSKPKIISLRTARRRLGNNYYVKNFVFLK